MKHTQQPIRNGVVQLSTTVPLAWPSGSLHFGNHDRTAEVQDSGQALFCVVPTAHKVKPSRFPDCPTANDEKLG